MTVLDPEVDVFLKDLFDGNLDVSLDHAAVYDPVKRREQYLRTRKLKGRAKGASDMPSGRSSGGGSSPARTFNGGTSNNDIRASRREKLEAEQKELLARLERLRKELREAVAKAKGRNVSAKPDGKEDTSSSSSKSTTKSKESSSSKSSSDSKDTKTKPLTEKQKSDKRKASKEQYEKEKGMTLSKSVDSLRDQCRDYRKRINEAVEEARKRNQAHQSETASKGSKGR